MRGWMGLAVVAALALSGCSGPAESGRTTITFVGSDPVAAFTPVITAFHAKNPTITVKYQNIPFDQYNNVVKQRVGGKDPSIDVLLVDAGAAASMASRKWLVDLTGERAVADRVSLPAAVQQSVYQNKLWALPMWTSCQYLYYNKDLLAKAGVAPPSIDPAQRWTWEQTTAAARKAQSAGAKWGLLFDQTDRYYQLQALAESAGGGSGATGPVLLTANITTPGWKSAMTWYGSLFSSGAAPRGVATDQMNVLFGSGKAAFFVGGPWSLTPISKGKPKVNYGVAPIPAFAGGKPAMPTGSWAIGISAASRHVDAAKKFAEFVSLSPEGNAAAVRTIIIPPTNKDAFGAYIQRLDGMDKPGTQGMGGLALSELKTSAVNRPNTVGFTQMQDVTGRAFSDIRNGGDPAATLQRAQAELQRLWNRL